MVVFPNAKINIGLQITEKRNDGFHNIESVFYPIKNLYDVLEIVDNDVLKFTSSGIEIPGDEKSNLCLKAYHLLAKDFELPAVHIHLRKVIPIGAGLGGGSSDAAYTLKLLNQKYELGLTDERLIDYARQLGSDCAFFIKNEPVFAFNKGDEFESIDIDLSNYNIKVSYPDIHIGTAEAYAGVVLEPSDFDLRLLKETPTKEWKQKVFNDFEKSIFPNHPKIEGLKEEFYNDGAVYASMTGSGSAVFGVFRDSND